MIALDTIMIDYALTTIKVIIARISTRLTYFCRSEGEIDLELLLMIRNDHEWLRKMDS